MRPLRVRLADSARAPPHTFGEIMQVSQPAEGVGFEPTRKLAPPSGFQARRHRPLGEPSSLRRGTDSVAAAADPCLVRSLDVRPWKSDPGVEPSLSYPAIGRRLPAVTAMPNIDPYRG